MPDHRTCALYEFENKQYRHNNRVMDVMVMRDLNFRKEPYISKFLIY